MSRTPAPTDGLFCAKCGGGPLGVADSRPIPEGVRRRRVCPACGERVTTFERCRLDAEQWEQAVELLALLRSMPVEWRAVVLGVAVTMAKTSAKP